MGPPFEISMVPGTLRVEICCSDDGKRGMLDIVQLVVQVRYTVAVVNRLLLRNSCPNNLPPSDHLPTSSHLLLLETRRYSATKTWLKDSWKRVCIRRPVIKQIATTAQQTLDLT
jgi:hypothetical protein